MDNSVHPDPKKRLKRFLRYLIISCVVSDSIIAVLQTFTFISQKHGYALYICEHIFLIVFVLETLVRWCYGFKMFWRSWWNIMNLLITLTLFVGHRVTSDHDALAIFRCLRLIRLTLGLCSTEQMDMTLKVTVRSFSEMKIIFFVSMIAILTFGVAGVDIFGTTLPSAFENLSLTFYTLFVCMTQDSWMETYKLLKKDDMASGVWTLLYFSIFILCSGLMLSMFDAWIQGNFIAQKQQAEQEHPTVNAFLKDSTPDANLEALDIIHVEVVKMNKSKPQKPLRNGQPENLTVENYENLVMVMLAIQRNTEEYSNIKQELQKVILKDTKQQDQEVVQLKESTSLDNMVNNEMATGDIISTIINLNNANLLNTNTDSPHLNINKIVKAGEQET